MGERQMCPAPDSRRDDDLESSLVLAVAGVMVGGAVLVGDEYDEVELLGTGFRCISAADDGESILDVSCLGRNDVNSPRRGPRFPDPDPEPDPAAAAGPDSAPIVSAIFFFLVVPRLKQATSLCHRPTSSCGCEGLECGDAVLVLGWWFVWESLRGRAGPLSVPCSSLPPVLSRRRGSSRVPCMRSLGGWRSTGVCSEGGPPFRGDAGQGRVYMTWQTISTYCVHGTSYLCVSRTPPPRLDQSTLLGWSGLASLAWCFLRAIDGRSTGRAVEEKKPQGGPLYR
jgi:hypothetical protein